MRQFNSSILIYIALFSLISCVKSGQDATLNGMIPEVKIQTSGKLPFGYNILDKNQNKIGHLIPRLRLHHQSSRKLGKSDLDLFPDINSGSINKKYDIEYLKLASKKAKSLLPTVNGVPYLMVSENKFWDDCRFNTNMYAAIMHGIRNSEDLNGPVNIIPDGQMTKFKIGRKEVEGRIVPIKIDEAITPYPPKIGDVLHIPLDRIELSGEIVIYKLEATVTGLQKNDYSHFNSLQIKISEKDAKFLKNRMLLVGSDSFKSSPIYENTSGRLYGFTNRIDFDQGLIEAFPIQSTYTSEMLGDRFEDYIANDFFLRVDSAPTHSPQFLEQYCSAGAVKSILGITSSSGYGIKPNECNPIGKSLKCVTERMEDWTIRMTLGTINFFGPDKSKKKVDNSLVTNNLVTAKEVDIAIKDRIIAENAAVLKGDKCANMAESALTPEELELEALRVKYCDPKFVNEFLEQFKKGDSTTCP